MSYRSLLLLVCFAAALAASPALGQEYSGAGNRLTRVTIKDVPVTAEVVDTPAKAYLGLGRRPSLAEGTGMLFILPTEGLQAFCMRDMQFGIDIIWIADGRVAGLEPRLAPGFKGDVVSPVPVHLVLEVPAGFAESHGIKPGDRVVLNLPSLHKTSGHN
jgi:uncharacterized membrane protein (UPF0127 family)